VSGYTGVLLNVGNGPGWGDSPWIAALFMFSGVSTGIALLRSTVSASIHTPGRWPDPSDVQACRAWLDEIPAAHVVGVAGNHDLIFDVLPGLEDDDARKPGGPRECSHPPVFVRPEVILVRPRTP